MIHRRPEFQVLDLATWPTLAWTEMETHQRERIKNHIDAIELSRHFYNRMPGSFRLGRDDHDA
ncbi:MULTISPECIES: hypothetical protein [Paraburkholderia]|uniref:hypothetical protein n=1 Tax=Paraburkholderia TaxID=1822464 RepID=UPI0038B82A75